MYETHEQFTSWVGSAILQGVMNILTGMPGSGMWPIDHDQYGAANAWSRCTSE